MYTYDDFEIALNQMNPEAFDNFQKEKTKDQSGCVYKDLKEFINNAMIWHDTKKGEDYWDDIHSDMRNFQTKRNEVPRKKAKRKP